MDVNPDNIISCASPQEFCDWLGENHSSSSEVWLKLYKKTSGIASANWEQCVIEALAWGWIDGLKKTCDTQSWYQRFTPRRPRSDWSKKNVAHVEKLMEQGRMQPAGLTLVEAARKDGRWDAAYAGSSDFEIPSDFLDVLNDHPAAQAEFKKLKRANLFAIYHRLRSAKKPETRQNRMIKMIETLAAGKEIS